MPNPYPFRPPDIIPPPGPERPAHHPPIPMVEMPGDGGLRAGIYEQLLAQRTVFVEGALDAETASFAAAQLMTLDSDRDGDDHRPVSVMVNSLGGPLEAVSALLDTVDLMRCPVDTTCLGQAVGTAAVVVAAGTGSRRCGPSAHFRLRLPDVEVSGRGRQLDEQLAQLRRIHEALVDRLVAATSQDRRLLERDIERGRALSAEEAVAYGLVDEVVTRRS